MKLNRYIFLLPFAVLFSACEKENSDKKDSEKELTIEAYSPLEDTKTVLGADGAVLWDGQESINVFCGTYSSKFTSSQTLNKSAKATFTGKIAATSGTLYAVYPYSQNNKYDSSTGKFGIILPDIQSAEDGSFDKNAFFAVASAGFDEPMHFKNVCGGFCFTLSSDKVKKVVFRGNNDEHIAGGAYVSFKEGVPVVQEEEHPAHNSITFYPIEHGQKFYIPMLPADFTKGFTVELWTDDNTHYDYVENSHKVLNRSVFGRVDDIDKGSIALVAEHISATDTRYTVKIFDKDASLLDWTWSVSDENVVSILSSSKNQCVVREKGYGVATISAKSSDGKYKASRTIIPASSISLNKTSLDFDAPNRRETLILTIEPANTTDNVEWSSSDTSVATVSEGVITSVGPGTATITATVGPQIAICKVFVNKIGAVDLGLSVKWANANLCKSGFVNFPEDYGDYYAWGEVETKSYFSSSNYKWNSSTQGMKLTKYNTDSSCGTTDGKTVLEIGSDGDDVASKVLGDRWRMPTDAEWTELITECTWTEVTNYNGTGVKGRLVTGPNGNSIFLPAAGDRGKTHLKDKSEYYGYYWSSSLFTLSTFHAHDVYFNSEKICQSSSDYRDYGQSVRPVYGEVHVSSISIKPLSLSLAVNNSAMLTATVLPLNAIIKSIFYTSSDDNVVIVDSDGRVTAKSEGTAIITATTQDGGKKASCKVTVFPDSVDLGLSVKWATRNLCESGFVSLPEDPGDYYAWGELEPYYNSQSPLAWKSGKTAGYAWASYRWCNGAKNKLTKYSLSGKTSYWDGDGSPDNKMVLDPEDDVARVKLGGKWRMPTDAEWTELRTKCTWTWITQNGVNGRKVTGHNGNSIFLPVAGYRDDGSLHYAGSYGYYWSSSLCASFPDTAYLVSFNSGGVYGRNDSRCFGLFVRSVSD